MEEESADGAFSAIRRHQTKPISIQTKPVSNQTKPVSLRDETKLFPVKPFRPWTDANWSGHHGLASSLSVQSNVSS